MFENFTTSEIDGFKISQNLDGFKVIHVNNDTTVTFKGVRITEPTPEPEPVITYPEPTGVNKILVEKYGYEWVNGKAWKPGTAPEPETTAPVEPSPVQSPKPEPTPSPAPEATPEPAPGQVEPEPALTPEPTPAQEPEPEPVITYPEPTGVNKILVEKYGYEWVNGKAWKPGTAPEPKLLLQ